MPAIKEYVSAAIPAAQISRVTPAGVSAEGVFAIGIDGHLVSYTATGQDTAATVAAALAVAWAAAEAPQLFEVTAAVDAGALLLTADEEGLPFTLQTTATGNGCNELQGIAFGEVPETGTWTLQFGSETTAGLPHHATAQQIEDALEPLSAIGSGNVSVSGTFPAYAVEFVGALARRDLPALIAESHCRIAAVGVTLPVIQEGAHRSPEIQHYRFFGHPSAGTFTLSVFGEHTAAIAYDATAIEVNAALAAAFGAGAALVEEGEPGPIFSSEHPEIAVTWTGQYNGQNVPLLTLNPAGLSGPGFSPTITELVAGVAPIQAQQNFQILGSPSEGTWRFYLHGYWSEELDHDITTSGLNYALQAHALSHWLPQAPNTFAAAELGPMHWRITWNENVLPPALGQIDTSGLSTPEITAEVTVLDEADPATAAVYKLQFSGIPTEGSFALRIRNYAQAGNDWPMDVTAYANDWNATAALIQAGIRALDYRLAEITVSGAYPTFYLTMAGRMAGRHWHLQILSDLRGPVSPQITTRQEPVPGVPKIYRIGTAGGGAYPTQLDTDGFTITAGTNPVLFSQRINGCAYTAAEIQTALEALPEIGAGNITVDYEPGSYQFIDWEQPNVTEGAYILTLTGTLAGFEGPAISFDDSECYRHAGPWDWEQVSLPIEAQHEQQKLTVGVGPENDFVSGTWSITFDGQTTAAIAWDATVGDIGTAIAGLPNLPAGGLNVLTPGSLQFRSGGPSGGGPDYCEVLFPGDVDPPQFTTNCSALVATGGTVTLTTINPGVQPQTRIDRIVGNASTTGGTFDLTIGWDSGTYGQNFAYNCNESAIASWISTTLGPNTPPTMSWTGGSAFEAGATLHIDWGESSSRVSSISLQPYLTDGDYYAENEQAMQAGEDAQTRLSHNGIAGTYWLSGLFEGQTYSYSAAWDETPASLETALNGQFPAGAGITCAAGPNGSIDITHNPTLTGWTGTGADTLLKVGSVNVQTTQPYVPPVPGEWKYRPTGAAAGDLVAFGVHPNKVYVAATGTTAAQLKAALGWEGTFFGGPWPANYIHVQALPLDDARVVHPVAIEVTVEQEPVEPVPEMQQIDFFAPLEAGTWTISFDGQTTAAMPWDTNTFGVQAALRDLGGALAQARVELDQGIPWALQVYFDGTFGADQPLLTVDGSNLSAQIECSAFTHVQPVAGTAELQAIDFSTPPLNGTWAMTFGETTVGPLAFDISAADLQAELRSNPPVFGEIVVAKPTSTRYTLDWYRSEGLNAPDPVVDCAALGADIEGIVTEHQAGRLPTYSRHRIDFPTAPTGGTWLVLYGSPPTQPTSSIPHNASAETLRQRLAALGAQFPEWNAVQVTGAMPTFEVQMDGTNYIPFKAMAVSHTLAGALYGLDGHTDTEAIAGQSTIQRLLLSHAIHAGSLTLSWTPAGGGNAEITTPIEPPFSAAAIQNAIASLVSWEAADVTVSGAGLQWQIQFAGAKAYQTLGDVPAFVIGTNALIATASPITVTETAKGRTNAALLITHDQAATGPGNWADPLNWEPQELPITGDTADLSRAKAPITDGLDQHAVQLAELILDDAQQSDAVYIGRPDLHPEAGQNEAYPEYRQKALRIGADRVTVRGCAGRVRLDTGTTKTAVYVAATAPGTDAGVPALLWSGTHAENTLDVADGSVGVAFEPDATANLAALRQAGGTIVCGPGVTPAQVLQLAGDLVLRGGADALTIRSGLALVEAGEVPALDLQGGTVDYRSAGELGAAEVWGKLDFAADGRAKALGELVLYEGATFNDPARVVAIADPVKIRGQLSQITIDRGVGFEAVL